MFDFTIWLCGHGETKDACTQSIFNALKRLPYQLDMPQYVSGDALIGRSRSVAATRFLYSNSAPYMIFVDTDIMFRPEELEMVYLAMKGGKDVVGGAYSVASGENFAIRGLRDQVQIDGQIHEVEYVSSGFMGISRKCLETIRDKCPHIQFSYLTQEAKWTIGLPLLHKGEWCECYPFFESGACRVHDFYLSEDWDFCDKARAVGFPVYFHTGALVDHCKNNIIVAESVLQKNMIKAPVQSSPDIGLFADIAEFLNLNLPLNLIIQQILGEPMTGDKPALLKMAQYNSYDSYKARIQPLVGTNGIQVLDYGCGIGFASQILAGTNKVVGYDPNAQFVDFANYRRAKHGIMNLEYTTKVPDMAQFDLVTMIDVLQYVQDIKPMLIEIGKGMKKGAKLYHIDVIEKASPDRFDHTKEIDACLVEAGFVQFNNLFAIKI